MSIASNFPAIKPTLLLDFANTQTLDPRITFTRSTTATYFDALGVMQTAASGVARFDHNPTTGESLGLLIEESRTNLLLNSASLATQNVTVTAVATTLSFYGTGTITLSGVSTAGPLVGTGLSNRVSLTFTPTAGTLTLTVTGTVQNAQLEAGAFATSYIPTVASQVTRAADAASMTGTNFSSWYNQAAGTLYMEANTPSFATTYVFAEINNNSTSNYVRQSTTSAGTTTQFVVVDNTVTQASPGFAVTLGSYRKMAGAYTANSVQQSVNGSLGTEDTSATIPTGLVQINIGSRAAGTSAVNGTIRKIAYYPLRVTNAQLQGLTS